MMQKDIKYILANEVPKVQPYRGVYLTVLTEFSKSPHQHGEILYGARNHRNVSRGLRLNIQRHNLPLTIIEEKGHIYVTKNEEE